MILKVVFVCVSTVSKSETERTELRRKAELYLSKAEELKKQVKSQEGEYSEPHYWLQKLISVCLLR